jgi:hypothetical protein
MPPDEAGASLDASFGSPIVTLLRPLATLMILGLLAACALPSSQTPTPPSDRSKYGP